MMVAIKQIWWRRFRGVFAGSLVIAVLGALLMGLGDVHSYRNAVRYSASYQVYQQDKKMDPKMHESYAAYRRERVRVYTSGTELTGSQVTPALKKAPLPLDGFVFDLPLLIAIAALGAFMAAWDHWSQFDRFIFGLGAKRTRYYWWRTGGLAALAVLGGLVHIGGYMMVLATQIPAADLSLTGKDLAAILGYNLALALGAGAFGHLVGLVVAHPVGVGVVVLGGGLAIEMSFTNCSMLLTALRWTDESLSLASPVDAYWLVLASALVLGALMAWVGARIYARLSLDYAGWLRLHAGVWPSAVVAAFLIIGATMSFDTHGEWQTNSLIVPLVVLVGAAVVAEWHRRRLIAA